MTLKLTKEQYDTFVFLKKYGITNALEKVLGKVTLGHGRWNHDLKPLNSGDKEESVKAITGAINVEVIDAETPIDSYHAALLRRIKESEELIEKEWTDIPDYHHALIRAVRWCEEMYVAKKKKEAAECSCCSKKASLTYSKSLQKFLCPECWDTLL